MFQEKRNALLDNAEVQPSTNRSRCRPVWSMRRRSRGLNSGTKRRHDGRVLMSDLEAEAGLTPS